MNIKKELKKELKTKLFRTLAITSCTANCVGFFINFLLHGFTKLALMCGACSVVLIALGLYGWFSKHMKFASMGIVSVAALFELPILIYAYGAYVSAYLILAVVCIALFLPKSSQWVMFGIVFIIDTICITLSYIVPSDFSKNTQESNMMTMLWAYCIVAIAVFVLVRIIILQYENQRAQIMKMTEELELVAHYDQLTGLYNRRYMMDTLEKWMTELDKEFIVVHIDLDDFKEINDTYGLVFGDSVLAEFGKILKENVKNIGFASRYGGQEFAMMIDKASKKETLEILEKIKEDFAQFSARAKQARFTFSAGLVVDDKTLDLDEILATADDKLRQAKRSGKNQIIA